MAFTKTFEYLSFDSTTAILYVRIEFRKDSVLYNTISSFPIQLPVDSLGRVPTGAALAEYVKQIVEVVYSPAARQFIRNLIDFGGTVTNASAIFALTIEDEPPVPLVRGIIYDEFDTPVEGASVQSLASGPLGAVTTNSLGEYLLPANADFELISVSTGQADFGIWPREQTTAIFGDTTLNIIVRAAASYGSNITITNADTQQNTVVNTSRTLDRAEVVLAAGSVVDSAGNPVSNVIVSIANSVISDLNYASAFPGFFLGTLGPETPFPIESFGFLEVRVSPVSGNEVLSLDPTKPATIRIPVFPNPVGVNTITLWRLDEETGIWGETGEATRIGDTLVFEATVTSFSFYNLDLPVNGVATLTVTAYDNVSLNDFNLVEIPAPGVSITADVISFSNGAVWQGRGVTGANGQLILSVPGGFLRVVGKKGDNTYNGFVYQQGIGTASIDLFYFAPLLSPPGGGFPTPIGGSEEDDSVPVTFPELVMAAGNNYSTPTTFLIVEDASELIELFEFGPWFLEFTTNTDFPAAVIEIDGNVIELSQEVLLIDDINEQGAGATITLIQG